MKALKYIKYKLYLICLSLLFSFSVFSQKNETISNKNISKKIIHAYNLSENFNDYELLKEVLDFITVNSNKTSNPFVNGRIQYLKAVRAYDSSKFNDSEKLAYVALNIAQKNSDKNLIGASYQLIGVILTIKGNDHLAMDNYNKSLKIFEEINANNQLIDIYYNLAVCHQRAQNWEVSKAYINKSINLINILNCKSSKLKFLYSSLAINNAHLKDTVAVNKNLEMAKALRNSDLHSTKREILFAYAKSYENSGNYKKAFEKYEETYEEYEVNKYTRKKKLIDKVKKELLLNDELNKNRNVIIKKNKIIITLSLLFLFGVILYIVRTNKISKKLKDNTSNVNQLNNKLKATLERLNKSNSNLKIKSEEVVSQLDLNERILFSKLLKLSTYNDSVLKVISNISKLIESNNVDKKKLKSVESILKMMTTDVNFWENFHIQYEKTKPNFFRKLKKIAPELSINDLKHCSYILAKLKIKDIANLINVSYRSVETSRYRIKKKMNLEPNVKLYDFLKNI